MRARVIYDPAEPVVIRAYGLEAMAVIDRAVLEAAGIPAVVHATGGFSDSPRGAKLVVRREHSAEALEILSAQPADEPDAGE
jgi:hypothetical protein